MDGGVGEEEGGDVVGLAAAEAGGDDVRVDFETELSGESEEGGN